MSLSYSQQEIIRHRLSDKSWRLSNLYYIKDKQGNKRLFEPNWAQQEILKNWHNQAIILKCRQIGITTLYALNAIDDALFKDNFKGGIIADRMESAQEIFHDKIRFAYDNLPTAIKLMRPCSRDNVRTLDFSNGSSISVSTGFRSGTCQSVHVSEFGPICFNNPKLAKEIVEGTLNTVAIGQQTTIESTSRGKSGYFYDFCKLARDHQLSGKPLGMMDRQLHFFPWYRHPEYLIWDECVITKEMQDYFNDVERETKIKLSMPQKWWYIRKAQENGDGMKSEYPSTFDEAFWVSNQSLYYHKELALIRSKKQIGVIPYDPALPVYNTWDLGLRDLNVILYWQLTPAGNIHFIDCDIGNDESLIFWIKRCKDKPYIYGDWFFPNDISVREYSTGTCRLDILDKLGVKPTILPFQKVEDGIEAVKSKLPICWFDEEKCGKALVFLENYRKKYNEKYDYYSGPLEDENAHVADCLRYSISAATQLRETRGYDRNNIIEAFRPPSAPKLGYPFQ